MKMRKIVVAVITFVVIALVVICVIRHSKGSSRVNDPHWQAAKNILNLECALKKIDDSWERQSISKVTPYTYTDPKGNTIVYYCCQTAYFEADLAEISGLDTAAISLVVDFLAVNKQRACEVNGLEAILCESDERSYLCWTLSPEISCVIEYSPEANEENNIFRMAESIQLPQTDE